MYLAHWNLREEPFQNVTDTRFAYYSDQHREGAARLLYLIRGRKLGGVLVGPYGVGKSMVLELVSQNLTTQPGARMVRFDVPPGGPINILKQIFWSLGEPRAFADMADALDALRSLFITPKTGHGHTVIAIDEAQMLRDDASFELLHLLTNVVIPPRDGQPEAPAFTLILSGHGHLLDALGRQPSLTQRLQLIWKLEPLNEAQTVEYVQSRMRAAGGDIWVFEEPAIHEIARASGGIPRIINNISDVALMMGCATGATRVTRDLVLQAIDDVQPQGLTSMAGGGG